MGQIRTWWLSLGKARSRASSAVPAARPPPPLIPVIRSRSGSIPELGRVLRRPHQPRVAVLDRSGVGVLGRQSVLDRHDDRTPADHMREEMGHVRPAVPHDHPATVDVEDATLGASVLDGAENQQSDVRRAVRPGYLSLLHPHPAAHRQILRFHPGEPLGHLPSDLWEGLVRHGWKSSAQHLLDGRELRVQWGPGGQGTEKVCCCLVCHLYLSFGNDGE
jgi:hypothetical protein